MFLMKNLARKMLRRQKQLARTTQKYLLHEISSGPSNTVMPRWTMFVVQVMASRLSSSKPLRESGVIYSWLDPSEQTLRYMNQNT